MTLKGALLCSAVFHAGFLVLRPPGALAPPRETLYPLEVSYLVLKRERPAPKVFSPEKRGVSRSGAPPVPVPKRAEPVPIPSPGPPKRSESPRPVPVENPAPEPAPVAGAHGSPGGAASLPAEEFAQIRHKEKVREHLRVRLQYPENSLQGTVRLRVTLLPNGRLKGAAVADASDPRLSAFALRDAWAATPYPRFPREMALSDAEYEFLVQYSPGDRSL